MCWYASSKTEWPSRGWNSPKIDLALDPIPDNGHTTTSTVSGWGSRSSRWSARKHCSDGPDGASRATFDLEELAAETVAQHVALATDLAGNRPRLARKRSGLRQRMQPSPLMNASRFATRGKRLSSNVAHLVPQPKFGGSVTFLRVRPAAVRGTCCRSTMHLLLVIFHRQAPRNQVISMGVATGV